MARGMPQQQTGQDNSLDFLWMLLFLFGAIFLIWYFGRVYIASIILYLRYYEILSIQFVFSLINEFTQFLGITPIGNPELNGWLQHIPKLLGTKVGFSELVAISNVVGQYSRYPLALLLIIGAIWTYLSSANYRFRHNYSAQNFKTLEQENWPQITPVVNLNLVNTPLDKPPWAFGLSPMRFCKKHDLLNITEHNGKYIVTLKRKPAHKLLILQLGPKWQGVNHLPTYLKALLAVFAAKINGDKKSADALLDQIAHSADSAHLNFNGSDRLLYDYMNTKKVISIIKRHGYVTTVLASLLVGARETGVVATSEFIWLKPIDRRMWYMLNSVGRQVALPEICGAFAHWLAEKKLGLPLTVPMVDEAVRGLELALNELIYTPDDEENN